MSVVLSVLSCHVSSVVMSVVLSCHANSVVSNVVSKGGENGEDEGSFGQVI